MPRVILIGGISKPRDKLNFYVIKFINQVAKKLAEDEETNGLLRIIFLQNHTNQKEHLYISALDVNEQLTKPGAQAVSTQPFKFIMNGSLLVGSRDSTNTRIENTLGDNICLLFGQSYH